MLDALAVAVAGIAAVLLVLAGVAKLRRPSDTSAALGLRLPGSSHLVRALGVGELVLAGGVLLSGDRWWYVALAGTYVAFLGVSIVQRRAGRSCACFGVDSGRVGVTHLLVDAVGASAAGHVAAWGLGAPLLGSGGAETLLAGGLVVLGAVLVRLLLTGMAELGELRARLEVAS